MNYVVGKTRQCRAPAVEIGLDLVRGRVFPDSVEDLAGSFPREHSFRLCAFQICLQSIAFVGRAYPDIPKPSRRRAVSGAHHLLGLTLPAVRSTPKGPCIARADCIHGIPELRGDPRIRRVLQHAGAFALLDFPADLASELKVVALVRSEEHTSELQSQSNLVCRL